MKTYFFRNPFASSRSTQRWKAVGPLLPRSRNIFPSGTRLDSGREHERLAISGFRWSRTRYRFDFIVLSSKITSHIFCLDIWMKLCITKLEQFFFIYNELACLRLHWIFSRNHFQHGNHLSRGQEDFSSQQTGWWETHLKNHFIFSLLSYDSLYFLMPFSICFCNVFCIIFFIIK